MNLYETLNSLVKGTAWSRFREKQLSNRTRELLGIKDTFSEKDVLIDLSGESGVHPWAREIMTRGLATSLYYMEKPIWGILADQPGATEWTLPDSFPKVLNNSRRAKCDHADYPNEDIRCRHCILKRWLKPTSGIIPRTVRQESKNFLHVRVGDLAGDATGASSPPLLRAVFGEAAYKPLGDGSFERPFRLQVFELIFLDLVVNMCFRYNEELYELRSNC